jgi:hypothetical protein
MHKFLMRQTQAGLAHKGHTALQQVSGTSDTEAGLLSGVTQKRKMHSRNCWFPEFCKSQHILHFTALFIVVRTETSIAESFKSLEDNKFRIKLKKRYSAAVPKQGRPVKLSTAPGTCTRTASCPCPSPHSSFSHHLHFFVRMILPQVHLRKPCYDFSFL